MCLSSKKEIYWKMFIVFRKSFVNTSQIPVSKIYFRWHLLLLLTILTISSHDAHLDVLVCASIVVDVCVQLHASIMSVHFIEILYRLCVRQSVGLHIGWWRRVEHTYCEFELHAFAFFLHFTIISFSFSSFRFAARWKWFLVFSSRSFASLSCRLLRVSYSTHAHIP